jgi:hypothetical protein
VGGPCGYVSVALSGDGFRFIARPRASKTKCCKEEREREREREKRNKTESSSNTPVKTQSQRPAKANPNS